MNAHINSRGQRNFSLAHTFLASFALNDETDDPTVLTIEEFDDWAAGAGQYNGINTLSRIELNSARNAVRAQLNKVGINEPWRVEEGQKAFQVDLLNHPAPARGIPGRYIVRASAISYVANTYKLPEKIERVADNGVRKINSLLESADMTQMPLHLQHEAYAVKRKIEQWKRRADFDLDMLNEDVSAFMTETTQYLSDQSASEDEG